MRAPAFLAALACVLQVSHGFPFDLNKRNLDSLARTGQLPEFKRSLASLAKSGQLPDQLVNEKRMLDELEQVSDANSKAIQEQRNRVAEEIKQLVQSGRIFKRQEPIPEHISEPISETMPEPMSEPDFRNEFKSNLREILDKYLKEFGTTYDQEKVELFLTNIADDVFDNHGVVSLDHIRYLIETGYFQPEFRDEKLSDGDSSPDDYIVKRFIASLARTSNMPYWSDSPKMVAKRYISSLLRQGKLPYVFQPTTEPSMKNPDWKMHRQGGQNTKRNGDDEAYQNDEEFIPVMQGARSLQSIIDDLAQKPIQKRYLGALSRSGWIPRGFASTSSRSRSSSPSSSSSSSPSSSSSSLPPLVMRSASMHPPPPSSYHTSTAGNYNNRLHGKRHLAALARLGWSFRNPHSFYMRNGRGSSFQCNIKKRAAVADDGNFENIERSSEKHGDAGPPASTAAERAQTDGLKSNSYLLLPAVDNILLHRQYPYLETVNTI